MSADEVPDDDALADFADSVLSLARKLALRGRDREEVVPLTGTEIEVIREVHRAPRTTPTQIAAVTGLRRSNVSVAIRVLESRGLLTRETPPGDGRSVELVPTDFAAENVVRIRALWVARLREAPESLLAECASAVDAIVKLDEHLTRTH